MSQRTFRRYALATWTLFNAMGAWLLIAAPISGGASGSSTGTPKSARSSPLYSSPRHAPPAATTVGRSSAADLILAADDRNLNVPIAQFIQRRNMERAVVRDYDYLFEFLPDLSADERRALLQLLYDRETGMRETRLVLAHQQVQPGTDMYQKAISDQIEKSNATLQALGGSKHPNIAELVALEPEMTRMNLLVSPALETAGIPFSPDQKLQFARVLKQVVFTPHAPASSTDLSTMVARDYASIAQKAAPFLSAEQLKVVKSQEVIEVAQITDLRAREGHR